MNFKRLVSIVLCVAMILTNANFSFALDSEAIQIMTQNLKSNENSLEFESDINNEKDSIIEKENIDETEPEDDFIDENIDNEEDETDADASEVSDEIDAIT